MADEAEQRRLRWSWGYHLVVLAVGLAIGAAALLRCVESGPPSDTFGLALGLGIPLIAVIARFPMVLEQGAGGIEVGFDSTVLMFLLCIRPADEALVVWAGGVLLTQLASRKRATAKVFNIGVGIAAGGLATAVFHATTREDVATLRTLLAVTLAAATYFAADYLLSALSVAVSTGTTLRSQLLKSGSLVALLCFVPFDLLGYLGAITLRAAPWWALSLLGVPLATLLIATRALTRGQENARRLKVLFDAAVTAQTLRDRDVVVSTLLRDASRLLRLDGVVLRPEPPGPHEVGGEVQLGEERQWIVARAMDRARSTVTADEQALQALAAVASDAIARLDITQEMIHVARHDPLTDLPNRGILLDRLTTTLRRGRPAALLFIDLDGFKPVNDRFGHAAGDDVLLELADRLRSCVRPGDTLARLGGDEFAVLVEDTRERDLPALCEQVVTTIGRGVEVRGERVRLGASVGLAYGSGAQTAPEVLRNADLAMYEAKARGKGRYVEYEPAMGRARVERLELVDDLRSAVDAAEIEVVYQPIVHVADGRIIGVEALARWQRDGVAVSPKVFITAAEETGLIVALGAGVLDRVAADTAAMVAAAGGAPLAVSVNVSALELHERGFTDQVATAVSRMGGASLVLEITERQGVDPTGGIVPVMRSLTALGVRFAIDDFGVGFSSLSYLHDLPAQVIKVDAALSEAIDTDTRARALLRSVVLMARALGFAIVVEGIERNTQLDVLRSDTPQVMAQGYLLHRPMPLDLLLGVLRAQVAPTA